MAVEVIGIDHVFVAVRDLEISGEFYDRVMGVLGFRKPGRCTVEYSIMICTVPHDL